MNDYNKIFKVNASDGKVYIINIQTCEYGWDYTVYEVLGSDEHLMEIDGGQIDSPDMTADEVFADILTGQQITTTYVEEIGSDTQNLNFPSEITFLRLNEIINSLIDGMLVANKPCEIIHDLVSIHGLSASELIYLNFDKDDIREVLSAI